MKKIIFYVIAMVAASISVLSFSSCDDGETYADMKEKEKKAIKRFLDDNPLIGKINVIKESEFYANDTTAYVAVLVTNLSDRLPDCFVRMKIKYDTAIKD